MKKSLIATLVAVPLLSVSAMSFAAEPVALTGAQMDQVTAGYGYQYNSNNNNSRNYSFKFKKVELGQMNNSNVTVVQLKLLSGGNGGNVVGITSGNSAVITQ